jgi:hypothetical protein
MCRSRTALHALAPRSRARNYSCAFDLAPGLVSVVPSAVWLGRRLASPPRFARDSSCSTRKQRLEIRVPWVFAKSELWPALTLVALLGLLLLVRLHAARECIVPPGIDSAQHTVIVQLLRDHHGLFQSWMPYDEAETFTYHFGFHAVTALFAWITGANSAYSVFVMSRAVGLCAAASLFALVRLWTRGEWGGVFAVANARAVSQHDAHVKLRRTALAFS